jgi:hypothetical protein
MAGRNLSDVQSRQAPLTSLAALPDDASQYLAGNGTWQQPATSGLIDGGNA